jgi:DNA-binding response OmpR family regulator
MRVLIVEDEPYMAEAICDGLRLEAIAGDGDTALDLLSINTYDIAVSALRKRPGEPWIIATAPGVGYRMDTGREEQSRG